MICAQTKGMAHRLEEHLLIRLPQYHVQWVSETDSTNTRLLQRVRQGGRLDKPFILGAQHQTAGRGRLGRSWLSPDPEDGLMFSCAFPIQHPIESLMSVTPVLGCATVHALRRLLPVHLRSHLCAKWPNDGMFGDSKLCGLLVEVANVPEPRCPNEHVLVVGLGLNLQKAQWLSDQLGREVADWSSIFSLNALEEEAVFKIKVNLVSALVRSWEESLSVFQKQGFSAFLTPYEQVDYLMGKRVEVFLNGQSKGQGDVLGLDAQGCLLLNTSQGKKAYCVGEVSVRKTL